MRTQMLLTHFLAHGHGKQIDDVAGLGVQFLEHLAAGGEQAEQGIGRRVQLPAKDALVQLVLAPVLFHVVLAQH